jgi:hypothetical protein
MQKSLVLVVGAGASKEVNLPVGNELRTRIASALDIRYENGYTRNSGDGIIDESFRILAREADPHKVDINQFLHSSWRIRDAMPQAISIDNFIDSHRSDTHITVCGKLAIARCILTSESQSLLYANPRQSTPRSQFPFASVEQTWFNAFFQLLTENCQGQDIAERLSKVAIICFNYDRCIEHYLYNALQNYYGMAATQAATVMTSLSIYHPYGTVGQLPWQNINEGIEYGANPSAQALLKIANGIRTFTEGIGPDSSILEIRQTLSSAERVAFLGFAFHPLNMQLLFPGLKNGEQVKNRSTYATAHQMSEANMRAIRIELSNAGAVFQDHFHFRSDLKCAQLLREFWRSLSLH